MRTYLVPIASSQESLAAFRLACLKAKRRGGKVQLLHVTEVPDEQTPFTIAGLMREEKTAEAQAFLKPLKEGMEEALGIVVDIIITEGQIRDQIVQHVTPETVFVALCRDQEHGSGELLEWLVSHLDKSLHVPLMVVPAGLSDEQLEQLA